MSIRLPLSKKERRSTGLRTKLVQLTLTVLIPVVVFAAWMLEQNVGYARSQLLASNLAQAQVAATSLEEYFSNIQTLLEALARLTVRQQQTPENLKALYVPALTARPSMAGIAAVDARDKLVAGLFWDSSQIRSDPFRFPQWPHDSNRPSVSNRLVWPTTGEGVIGISVPIRNDDGTFTGELLAWVPLKQLLLKLDRDQPANVIVSDSFGLILAHPDWSYLDRPVNLRELFPTHDVMPDQRGIGDLRSHDGEEWVTAYAPATSLGWSVLVAQPGSQLYPPIEQAKVRWAVFLVMAVVLAVGLGILTAGRITGPLAELNRNALLLAEGDLTRRTQVQSGDELEQLGGAFNEMADSLQNTVQQLSETRLEVEKQARTLRMLLARVISTQEHERLRIARDLHDEVHQLMIGAMFQMQAAGQLLTSSPTAAGAQLECALEIVNKALSEVKRVTLNLRPPRLEEGGLVPALRCLLEDSTGGSGIEFELRESLTPSRLSEEKETAIYRVVQESLSNIRRHSGASHVSVDICRDPSALRVEITDNGRGFTPHASDDDGQHLGITGMVERAESVGGALEVKSSPGGGTTVAIVVPFGKRKLKITKGAPA